MFISILASPLNISCCCCSTERPLTSCVIDFLASPKDNNVASNTACCNCRATTAGFLLGRASINSIFLASDISRLLISFIAATWFSTWSSMVMPCVSVPGWVTILPSTYTASLLYFILNRFKEFSLVLAYFAALASYSFIAFLPLVGLLPSFSIAFSYFSCMRTRSASSLSAPILEISIPPGSTGIFALRILLLMLFSSPKCWTKSHAFLSFGLSAKLLPSSSENFSVNSSRLYTSFVILFLTDTLPDNADKTLLGTELCTLVKV